MIHLQGYSEDRLHTAALACLRHPDRHAPKNGTWERLDDRRRLRPPLARKQDAVLAELHQEQRDPLQQHLTAGADQVGIPRGRAGGTQRGLESPLCLRSPTPSSAVKEALPMFEWHARTRTASG